MNPSNPYGVSVVHPCIWDKPPIEMPDENVADSLSEAFKRWCYGQPVMITAPTGGGKTTLVIKIAGYCHKRNPAKWICLVVNRTAIAVQQMQILASALGSKWAEISDPEVFELFEVLEDIHVIVTTYQGLAAHGNKFPLNEVEWVIFDEAHVFHADSLFNPQLDQLFQKLPNLFSRAYRVYLTATADSVLHEICDAEKRNLYECAICNNCIRPGKGCLLHYKFPAHSQHIDLHYFRKRNEIVDLVKQNPKDQVVIFTSVKEDPENPAKSSYSKLLTEAGISWGYLDSAHKGTPLWKKVCRDGTFDEQVLIATSVLDCGVNLNSDRLRHIIVESSNQMEFLQMIGRHRAKKHDTLKVYIRAYSQAAIEAQLRTIEKHLSFIKHAYSVIKAGNSDSLVYSGWMDESNQRPYMHLLNYLGDGSVLPKPTAKHYLEWQQIHLERLLELFNLYDDDSALPRMAHKWLGQEGGYSADRWLDHDFRSSTKAELLELLEKHAGKVFDKTEFQSLVKDVLTLVNRMQAFAHDTRSTTNRKASTVNKRLERLHIPYEFQQYGQGSAATFSLTCIEGRCE